jgi:DNA-binding CsgD family transcriptional regulator
MADAHDAPDLASFRGSLLRRLERTIGADTAAALPAPGPLGGDDDPRGASASGLDEGLFRHFLQCRSRYHVSMGPAMRAMLAGGGLVIDTDVYGRRDRERLDVYVETMIPSGIRSTMAAVLSFRGRATSLVCLNRHSTRAGFGARDLERMRRLLPLLGMVDAAVAGRPDPASSDALGALTPREGEVAALIQSGLRNREIAAFLGTSPETVRKQTLRIYEKLAVSGRVQLVARFGDLLAKNT